MHFFRHFRDVPGNMDPPTNLFSVGEEYMKTAIFTAAVAAIGFAAPALAWDNTGYAVQCYNETYVGPTYEYSKKLIREAEYKWEHNKAGQLVKVYYPPVYEQVKTKTARGYVLEVPAACK